MCHVPQHAGARRWSRSSDYSTATRMAAVALLSQDAHKARKAVLGATRPIPDLHAPNHRHTC
eukprot:7534633-Prorocentrum_lima.AAC.1